MHPNHISSYPPGHSEDTEYVDLSDLFRRVRRRLWLPLLLFAVGVAGAVGVSAATRPAYESEVRILFPGMGGVGGGLAALAASFGADTGKAQPLDMYAQVLKSTQIVVPVLEKYRLDRYGVKVKEPEDVNGILAVKTDAKSATLTLTAIAPTAPLAPALADEFCRALSRFVRDAALSDNKNSAAFLARRIGEVERRLRRKDEELRRYQEANRTAGAAAAGAAAGGPLGGSPGGGGGSPGGASTGPGLASQLAQVTAAVSANQARIAEVRRQLALQVEHPERLAEGSDVARGWRDRLAAKAHELALAEAQYGPEHPRVVLLKKEISDIRSRIAEEVSDARYALEQGVTPELARLLAEREALLAQRASLAEELGKIPAQEMRVTQLARESALLSALYAALQQRYQEAQLAEMNDPSRFVFLDKPSVPLRPVRPRWKRNLALGGLLGLALGTLLALSLPEQARTVTPRPSPLPEGGGADAAPADSVR